MADENEYLWDPGTTADPEIARMEALLRPLRHTPVPAKAVAAGGARPLGRRRRPAAWTVALAAALILAVGIGAAAGVAGWFATAPGSWRVTRTAGLPRVNAAPLADAGRVTPGQVIETDHRSRARLDVGRIGDAELGPNTKVRLVRSKGSEHRLALEYGRIRARIGAPPRFFMVETPNAVAVDLGCIYSLDVDALGIGLLRVESGRVELVQRGVRSLVPAGSAASMRPGAGPGLTYSQRASLQLRNAIHAFERGAPADSATDAILAASVDRWATITLWHLIPRVDGDTRARVVRHLATLAPPPAGVTLDGVARLDEAMLDRWNDVLEPTWSTVTLPRWERALRRVQGWVVR